MIINQTKNIRRGIAGATVAAAAIGTVATLGTATAAAATHPAATVNDITVTAKTLDNSSAGHSYAELVLTNTGNRIVSVRGFSGVSFVADGNGTQVGVPATWLHDHSTRTITLKPGQHTGELVRIADPAVYGPTKNHTVTADGFRVYLPGQRLAEFAPLHVQATTRDVTQLAAEPVGVTS
ncbi:hypothetical protein GCM10011575_26840 [Microlunatus endophyticus]|uniref:DUF4232 domain-containing protein n=1 Tax=Microlunatus endophyticus TaxID=1716077 RepID=A0A917SB63_9ACTN|nr:DUF4232 domain-containing protein [Microlunatus endophyticus]GGL66985.1 hypothetical protein GCM10011575_26840 [Microlunatus endophyticus]